MIIRDAFHLIGGGTPSTTEPKYWGTDIPWISSSDIDDFHNISVRRFVTDKGVEESATNRVSKGTVIVVTRVGLGKVALLPQDMCFSQDIQALVPKPNISINRKFILFQLTFIMSSLKYSSQGTTISGITKKQLSDASLYLPPLPEQERIVARIEELFSELDKGVEALQTIKAQLRVYRQAVLKEAFEGVLTKEWRHFNIAAGQAERDFLACKLINPNYNDTSCDESALSLSIPLEWKSLRLGDVFTVEVGATPSRKISDYWNGDICWVSSGEVKFSEIYSTKECITQEGLKHASTNVHPKGTVLLAMIGEGKTRGQAAILRTKAAHNQNTAAILVSKTPCVPEYIYYFLMLTYDYTRRVGSGNNQKALNKERVRAIKFPFAPFSEQITVVAEIESRLSVCDQIEKTVDVSLAKAESLRQSILKKAFEGRLV